MIEKLKAEQIDRVMEIWLEGNKSAHPFLSPRYWDDHYDAVKNEYLPNSQTVVYVKNSNVCGFLSIMDNAYIGALFVAEEFRGHGIGTELIAYCKQRFPKLTLAAYVENERAVAFYKRQGFQVVSCSIADDGVHEEYAMIWETE